MVYMLAMVLVSLCCGILAFRLARTKGRSEYFWTLITVFFVFPLLILVLLPTSRTAHESN